MNFFVSGRLAYNPGGGGGGVISLTFLATAGNGNAVLKKDVGSESFEFGELVVCKEAQEFWKSCCIKPDLLKKLR